MFAGWSWDGLWETEPQFRRIWRVSSVIWGSGLLVDAAVRVVISYALPVDAVPGLGGLLYPVTFVVLQVITNVYYNVAGLYPILGARWAVTRSRDITLTGVGVPAGLMSRVRIASVNGQPQPGQEL